ncbi:MAG: signal recognition particle-docking protein FtsY, partial [Finegoldia magna]|nr:signal recognition particle-docking protein FtsY [Finegoldia magna]
DILKENIINDKIDNNLNVDEKTIILVVGVNGVGKTTTIGKLAMKYKKDGKKVLMVAADTFRAAAIEQLTEWSNRAKVDIISHKEGADPASVVFDGVNAMKSRNTDILICDTAGRLHNKKNLMNELNKIKRVIEKEYPEAKKEILLIVDGTTGQNAIIQAKEFMNATDLTGAIITKLDGTAKGGMIFPLEMELGIPVKFIGIGEQVNDLVKFEPEKFIEAIIN